MPQVGQLKRVVEDNGLGTSATTVTFHTFTPEADGHHVITILISSATCQLQVVETDQATVPNAMTSLLNRGAELQVGVRHDDLVVNHKAGNTYAYSMVFSTGAPSCDQFVIHSYDERGDG